MKTFNDWMNEGRYWEGFRFFNRRVVCADGFSISIQANNGAYCQPRRDINDFSAYYEMELGFPNARDEFIAEYAETPSDLTGTVYPYVPRDIVEGLLNQHGGIVGFYSKDA